jgi:hypothetical protein
MMLSDAALDGQSSLRLTIHDTVPDPEMSYDLRV